MNFRGDEVSVQLVGQVASLQEKEFYSVIPRLVTRWLILLTSRVSI